MKGMLHRTRTLAALTLSAGLFVGSMVDTAAAAPVMPSARAATYTVAAGDYLFGIALRLGVKIDDLLAANGLRLSSVILPGQVLVVPGTSGSVASAPAAAPAPKATTATASSTTYTVVAGDSIIRIAGRLGVTVSALLSANKLNIDSVIVPGLRLKVPAGGAATPAPATPAAPAPATATPLRYTVAAGDSLSKIADLLGVGLSALRSTNGLTAASVIHPGQRLVVPAGGSLPAAATPPAAPTPSTSTSGSVKKPVAEIYVVVAGDGLSRIADKLGVTLSALLTTNSLTVSSFIYPGMRLTVPAGGRLPGATPAAAGAGASGVGGRVGKVLDFALAQVGKAYQFNTSGPTTFDCSGLTMAAYAEIGISLPHYSAAQAMYGTAIDWTTKDVRPGDLVFLETTDGSGIIGHVGIATSATSYVHATRTGDFVRVSAIPFDSGRVVAVRRMVTP